MRSLDLQRYAQTDITSLNSDEEGKQDQARLVDKRHECASVLLPSLCHHRHSFLSMGVGPRLKRAASIENENIDASPDRFLQPA